MEASFHIIKTIHKLKISLPQNHAIRKAVIRLKNCMIVQNKKVTFLKSLQIPVHAQIFAIVSQKFN